MRGTVSSCDAPPGFPPGRLWWFCPDWGKWSTPLMSDTSFFPLSFFFLSTGFAVGFGHCIGMCGPIVVSLSLSLEDR
ncbi:MAG: sulfite exporter TauE/SafE family protein, partial [Thermodesulfobacteriota bacterium]